MIKFFRKIRQGLLSQNKFSKYLLYALGEIILVVIGILIALQINNWNQKQLEKKQIRNIYSRIIQDFNHTAAEIDNDIAIMDKFYPLMQNITKGEVNRDSLITNPDYFNKYYNSTNGFPDIKIIDTGIRLLESKIELNYELNNDLTEALSLLYSENLFEIEVDAKFLHDRFWQLSTYIIEKGIRVDYIVNKNRTTFTNMVFEDEMFKNYFLTYAMSYGRYRNMLKNFKTKGGVLIDKIKVEYSLE